MNTFETKLQQLWHTENPLSTWMFHDDDEQRCIHEDLLLSITMEMFAKTTQARFEWQHWFESYGFIVKQWDEHEDNMGAFVAHLELTYNKSTQREIEIAFDTVDEKIRQQPYQWSSDDARFLLVSSPNTPLLCVTDIKINDI